MRPLTPLCELAKKYETDKGGRHLRYGGGDSGMCHEYTPVYYDLLSERRETVKLVLELGVHSGASLRMWRDFFPAAHVVGVDSDGSRMFTEERITTYPCDLGDRDGLIALRTMLLAKYGQFDLILDDASHEPGHQLLAAREWPMALAPGGLFVIEDIGLPANDARLAELMAVPVPAGMTAFSRRTEPTYGTGSAEENIYFVRRDPCAI